MIGKGYLCDPIAALIFVNISRALIMKSPSTVSREINRNGGSVKYRALAADKHALKKALRPKAYKLQKSRPIIKLVEAKLLDDWSPEQTSGWLKRTHNKSPEMQVSHETIYKTLFIQCREVFDMEALTHLRSKLKLRHGNDQPKKAFIRGSLMLKLFMKDQLRSRVEQL
jgi:IS30 family transposase